MSEPVLVVGAGYTGGRIVEELQQRGRPVIGTTREPPEDRPEFIRPFTLDQPEAIRDLIGAFPTAERIRLVFTPGPPLGGDRRRAERLMEDFLAVLPFDRIKHFLYLSSTSVYGDTGGEWVTEDTPMDPMSESGKLRMRVERMLQEACPEDTVLVRARIGGIYGPGRSEPTRYLDPEYRLVGGGEKWTNRIHVEDLARALVLLSLRDVSEVVNLTDRRPVHLRTMVEFLYRRAGRDSSRIRTISWEQAEREFSEMRLGLLKPQKRVSSEKLRQTIGFTYRYPTVFHGLPPLMDDKETGASSAS